MSYEETEVELHARLELKRLNPRWAKLEIVLGMFAVATGFLLSDWSAHRSDSNMSWSQAAAAILLVVFGGYLAMAGHRSHLYQSNNRLTALLMHEIRRLKSNEARTV
jgi:hypothetical protein